MAQELGLEQFSFVKGAVWGDVNNDALPDLFVSNYGEANKLFINRGGDFEEIAIQAGVSAPHYSFTCWFWDYDQDGWQDLLVFGYDNRKAYMIADEICKEMMGLSTSGEFPRLYRNNGDETFTDLTDSLGLNKLIYAMGGNFGDLDNDGYPDFYAGYRRIQYLGDSAQSHVSQPAGQSLSGSHHRRRFWHDSERAWRLLWRHRQ